MISEIITVMKERQQTILRNGTEYMELNNNIVKVEWFNEKCAEIKKKKALKTSAAGMHKKVKEISEEEIYSLVGCIKPQDLTIIVRNKRHL